jgi:hypothetical protein
MTIRQIKDYLVCITVLIFISGYCFGQNSNDSKQTIISVYSTQSYLIPPFVKKEIRISNYQLCHQNILIPKHRLNKVYLNDYDQWDTMPRIYQMETIDYDSIVNFIMTSGLLNIDLNYTKPDTTGGIVIHNSGGGPYVYVIETNEKKLELLIHGSVVFKLPEVLNDFDKLFRRVSNRYNKNE